MRRLRELLRLKYETGLTHRAIAQACALGLGTVSLYLQRATAAGLTGFSGSLIGLGGAPLLVGLLSDHFAQSTGAGEALRTALGIAGLVALLMSAMLLAANLAFSRSLTRQPPLAQSGEPEPVTI